MIVPSNSTRLYLEKASAQYAKALPGSAAEGYLVSRGISLELASRFQLGVVSDPVQGHEQYEGWMSIPYLTPSGSVTTIRFRNLTPYGPKYLSIPGDIPRIFNTAALERSTPGVVITEGELDAMSVELAGFPAVAIPGATSWHPSWRHLFAQYDFTILLQDDDAAGKEMSHKLSHELDGLRTVVMRGGDTNDYLVEKGPEALADLIKGKR